MGGAGFDAWSGRLFFLNSGQNVRIQAGNADSLSDRVSCVGCGIQTNNQTETRQ
jgi:hypothetical protein